MKLKKIIIIFLSKISNFFNVLKLNNAYREKTTEKKRFKRFRQAIFKFSFFSWGKGILFEEKESFFSRRKFGRANKKDAAPCCLRFHLFH